MAATILVVDDEKNIRRTLRMVLEGSGFNTLEASSAEQCLETLENNEVDLLILDVRLPKMSGIEALEKIRSEPETRRLPVLMVSGHASVAEAVQAWLSTLSPEDLERQVENPMGEMNLGQVLETFILWHINAHCGEIAALKGCLGVKGYPF